MEEHVFPTPSIPLPMPPVAARRKSRQKRLSSNHHNHRHPNHPLARLRQALSTRLLAAVGLACLGVGGYRVFVAPPYTPPLASAPAPPTASSFTKSWLGAVVAGLGVTIAAATARAVARGAATADATVRGGTADVAASAVQPFFSASSAQSPATYLTVAVVSGLFAAVTFATGIYSLFLGSVGRFSSAGATNPSLLDMFPSLSGLVQMAALAVVVPLATFFSPSELLALFNSPFKT